MEVPLVGSEATRWSVVSVPRPRLSPAAKCSFPAPRDCAAAVIVPSASNKPRDRFIIWRLHESAPTVMEVVQFGSHQNVPSHGLRLSFEEELCPFADVVPIEVNNGQGLYFSLTVVTASGIVYILKLPVSVDLWNGFVVSGSNMMMRDLSGDLSGLREVTAFAAAKNTLFVGGQNGSVFCFSLFTDLSATQNMFYELKGGDAGIGRLWGLVSRSKIIAPVKSLGVQDIHNKTVLFVLHEDGALQAWDPLHHLRFFSHNICPSPELAGSSALNMWIEDGGFVASKQLAILFSNPSENARQIICIYGLDPVPSSGFQLGLPTLQQVLQVEQGVVVDAKLVQGSLWVLKQSVNTPVLIHFKLQLGVLPQNYQLQEEELLRQLIQDDDSEPAVSQSPDLFLRRFMQPRVFHHESVQEFCRKHGSSVGDVNLRTVSEDEWRRELATLITEKNWNELMNEYNIIWKKNNIPYALLSDVTTGCLGLVRRSSFSIIRSQTSVEKASSTCSPPFANGKESQILTGLLACMSEVRAHIGSLSLAAFDETLLQSPSSSFDQLVSAYVRSLDIGDTQCPGTKKIGVDELRERKRQRHLKQRKFNLRICHLLREMRNGTGSWDALFDCIAGYEKYLLFGSIQKLSRISTSGNALTKLITQATSQILWSHYEETRTLILFLELFIHLKSQVNLSTSEGSRLQLQIFPRLKTIMLINLLLYWLTVTHAELPYSDDFNSLLSSLKIDGPGNTELKGSVGFGQLTLADILATFFLEAAPVTFKQSTGALMDKGDLLDHARGFITWLSLGEDSTLHFSRRIVALSVLLLQHGQYRGLENFLALVEKFSNDQTYLGDILSSEEESSPRLHIYGLCILACACRSAKESRSAEQIKHASSCFFRAAEGWSESSELFHSLFKKENARPTPHFPWKLHYFELVMQIFEQYGLSEGATQFALAALDQADKASNSKDVVETKGRLWANVFKFSMDLEDYEHAYNAIISNPDDEAKLPCLRRFVVVLCERKVPQILCGSGFPYAGLLDVVEQELSWKAEYSDISSKPSAYKLLYGFHLHRHNYRRAAESMYRYAMRMRDEGVSKSRLQISVALQEQVNGLAAAVNALKLVGSSAWIDVRARSLLRPNESSPSKRLRCVEQTKAGTHAQAASEEDVVDIEELNKQYAVAVAKLELVQANIRHPTIGSISPSELVGLLVQNYIYDTAFATVFRLFKHSSLKRELEKMFELIARNCCTTDLFTRPPNEKMLLLPGLNDHSEMPVYSSRNKSSWQALQTNLEKYERVHPRLPVIVAETILSVNKNMELPLWLIDMLKGGKSASPLGMAEQGDPAALLRIYIDNGRFVEASSLVLEYLRAWSNMRPSDVIKRKRMSATWFSYALIDRLQQSLAELSTTEQQCAELSGSLQEALQVHLKQMKADSDDIVSLQKTLK